MFTVTYTLLWYLVVKYKASFKSSKEKKEEKSVKNNKVAHPSMASSSTTLLLVYFLTDRDFYCSFISSIRLSCIWLLHNLGNYNNKVKKNRQRCMNFCYKSCDFTTFR